MRKRLQDSGSVLRDQNLSTKRPENLFFHSVQDFLSEDLDVYLEMDLFGRLDLGRFEIANKSSCHLTVSFFTNQSHFAI